MKKITPLMGAAGLAIATFSAHAQVFQYHDGDLILDFSRSGSSDLEVDIGNVSQFTGLAPGQTVTINGYDVNNQLLATFGGNLNSIQFGVIGTQSGSSADYLTLRETTPGVQNLAPNDFTFSKATTVSSDINGIIGNGTAKGILPYSQANPADPVGNTATAVVIPTTGVQAVNSFSSIYNGTGGLKSALPSPGVLNTTASNFSSTPGATAVSDLFDYTGAGSGTPSTYLGEFTLGNNGTLTFTAPSAVPEPSSLALLAGFGALVFVWRHRTARI